MKNLYFTEESKKVASRHFKLGEGPSRDLLRDCENQWIIWSFR